LDKNSRNVVKFIATITLAALLIMAARFYAESQMEPMPSAPADPVAQPVKIDATPKAKQAPQAPVQNDQSQNAEEIPAITGEPSVNIEPSEPVEQEGSSPENGD
jgi:hypothetical protein